MKVGGLFSGIGGMELGLERSGMELRWFVENNEYCRSVLQKNWSGVMIYGDIKSIEWSSVEKVDVLCGGFPCQDISIAGNNAGLSGARSGLWSEFVRAIDALKPRIVIVENVAALLERGMATVIADLHRNGYCPHAKLVEAKDFGAPHKRRRLFIVAHTLRERCDDCLDYERYHEVQEKQKRNASAYRQEWQDMASRIAENIRSCDWATAAAGVRRVDDASARWVDRIAALGNAVVPIEAEAIGNMIRR